LPEVTAGRTHSRMRSSGRLTAYFATLLLCTAGVAQAANPDAPAISVAGVLLEDDLAVPPRGWVVLIPAHAMLTTDAAQTMIVSAYVRNDAKGLQSILLVQRNLLPTSLGWGSPSACASQGSTIVAIAYRSVRDMLCGWAHPIAFGAHDSDIWLADLVQHALEARDALPAAMLQSHQPPPRLFSHWLTWSEGWLGKQIATEPEATDAVPQFVLAGWRISDRHDVLDVQLLVRGDVAPSLSRLPLLLARATHTLGETWRDGQPTESAIPDSIVPPQAAANPFDGDPSQAKSFFARTVRTAGNWTIAGIALGSSAAGVTMAAVLDAYSAATSWANDYVWDKVSPLRPETQDFIELAAPR
jgi:hypothetical protein